MAESVRGRDLRVHRIRAGLTQKELGDKLGIHHSLISAAEMETIAEFVAPDFADRYVEACQQAGAAA